MVFDLLEVKEKVKRLESESGSSATTSDTNNEKLRAKITELEAEKKVLLKKSKALSDEY